jgi:hypothetical protein
VVGAATMAPVGANVISLRASSLRTTCSFQYPAQLAVPARGVLVRPPIPHLGGLGERIGRRLRGGGHVQGLPPGDERHALPGRQRERRAYVRAVRVGSDLPSDGEAPEAEPPALPQGDEPVGSPLDGRGLAGVVRARAPDDLHLHVPAHGLEEAVDLGQGLVGVVVVDGARERHEVRHHEPPPLGVEGGFEDVRVREVPLLAAGRPGGRHAEVPAAVGVEEGGEHARGIDLREAEPVERPVEPDERDGPEVADGAVGRDRLVRGGVGREAVRAEDGGHREGGKPLAEGRRQREVRIGGRGGHARRRPRRRRAGRGGRCGGRGGRTRGRGTPGATRRAGRGRTR